MPALHAFANPARFLKIARPLTPLLFWLGAALIAFGAFAGLALLRLQGAALLFYSLVGRFGLVKLLLARLLQVLGGRGRSSLVGRSRRLGVGRGGG